MSREGRGWRAAGVGRTWITTSNCCRRMTSFSFLARPRPSFSADLRWQTNDSSSRGDPFSKTSTLTMSASRSVPGS